MRLTEITKKEFDVYDFNRNQEAYVIYLSEVVPVIVKAHTNFQDTDYKVHLISHSETAGILHVAQADIFRTEEAAKKELMKRKLAGKNNTSHMMMPRW